MLVEVAVAVLEVRLFEEYDLVADLVYVACDCRARQEWRLYRPYLIER